MSSPESIFWSQCRRCGEGLGPFATAGEARAATFCEGCQQRIDEGLEREDEEEEKNKEEENG